ncbi:MAG: hypothetical protein ACOYIE_06815 [Agathobaculum sp.]|jgi:hypothetical protein|uniref:hypothetical protein n=1 Tax=Agathobaculum sp. TaxID=2048138 RepID=UPI003D91322E
MTTYPYLYTDVQPYRPFFSLVLPMLALLAVLAGGLALYFLFVRRPNTFQGAAARLHDFFNFRTFFTDRLLRMMYAVTAVGLTVYSLFLLFTHFFAAFLVFVLGNLAARLAFEFAMLLLGLCRDVRELNRKTAPPAEPQSAAAQPGPAPHADEPEPPQAPLP